jgi:hypothetical protein
MFLAQTPSPQIPDLPAGPALDRVRGPVEIPPFEPWQIGVMAALGLLVLCLLAWGTTRFIRSRTNRRRAIQPHSAALAELDAAATHTADNDERFAVLSSLALRRYFEDGIGIPALERTTLEFLHSLEGHPKLNSDASASLTQFLEQCDRVKFAQASLTEAERNALTTSAKQLIQQFKQVDDAAASTTFTSPSLQRTKEASQP